MEESKWFVGLSGRGKHSLRMFALPYSGGNAYCYAHWRERLLPEVELVGVQLPGRSGRMDEPSITTMRELVSALIPHLSVLLYRPYVLFGHSNGALMAFAILDQILREALPPPLGMVLSGKGSPTRSTEAHNWSTLPDDRIVQRIRALGGTPEEVLGNEDLMRMIVPVLRGDFALGESFQPAYWHPAVATVPALILAGEADRVAVDDVFAWTEIFSHRAATARFEGGHFFINEGDAALERINEFLKSVLAKQAGNSELRLQG